MKKANVLTALALTGIFATAALAQEATPSPERQRRPREGEQPQPGGRGMPDQQRRDFMMRMMGGQQPGAIFAVGKFVYVLRGDTLFQLRADDLESVKKVTIPSAQVDAAAGGAMQAMMMGSRLSSALFANEKFVYVMRGDSLFQFRAESLDQIHKTDLPSALPPMPEGERPEGGRREGGRPEGERPDR